jgi:membrane protein involved in colicin uptake
MNLPVDEPSRADGKDTAAEVVDESEARLAAARRAATRKKLDEVFGDVLPTVTRDELGDGSDGPSPGNDRDRWYRDNRPPHHG